jgi:hypothetical protein
MYTNNLLIRNDGHKCSRRAGKMRIRRERDKEKSQEERKKESGTHLQR